MATKTGMAAAAFENQNEEMSKKEKKKHNKKQNQAKLTLSPLHIYAIQDIKLDTSLSNECQHITEIVC